MSPLTVKLLWLLFCRCDQFVFMHRTNNQEILDVTIRSPEAATYRFELVGRDSTILDEDYDYDWVAIYRVVFRYIVLYVTLCYTYLI